MKTIFRALSCSDMRDKGFLLKIYLENHKLRVDGIVNKAIEEVFTVPP